MRGWTRLLVGLALIPLFTVGVAGAAGGNSLAGWKITILPVDARAASSFSEPGVAAGRDGLLVENACTANTGSPSTFWLSHDDGKTWSHGFSVGSSAIGCGDSDAAAGSDGYLYSLTLGTGVDVYRSHDGKAWQGPAMFPPPHGVDQPDRPWLVLIPNRPNEVLMFNSEVGGNAVMWRSVDHAATFSGPVLVTGGSNSQAALALGSRPLVDPTNNSRMYLFYETAGEPGLVQSVNSSGPSQFPLTQLWVATSDDGGQHWSNQLVLDVTTAFGVGEGSLGHLLPATTIDSAGNRYVVLSVRLGAATTTHLFLIHSTRYGAWSKPVKVDSGTESNVFPAVAVARQGHLFVSWYGSTAKDFNDPHARWTEMFAATTEGLAAHPRFAILRLSGAEPVHVGAVDNMGAIGFDIGQNWALRDFQSVTVDGCGHAHVTWAADYKSPRTYAATTIPFCPAG